MNSSDFTLVLSGGGALGIAHLGVLADLEKYQMSPKEIIGTSMGSIIGACLSIGLCENEIHGHIKEFSSIYNWIKFSFSGNAVISNDKILNIFDTIFGDKKMHETKIPLKLIATNLHNGEKRVFDSSSDIKIKEALVCSMAIPGIFEEYAIDGISYADGFLCENLGISEATLDNVLAVDVLGKNAFKNSLPNNLFKTLNLLEMFEKSMRLLIYNQTKSNIEKSQKNIILLEPNTKEYKTFHFHKYQNIRSLGLGLVVDNIFG
jgi:NTE family protein